MNLMDFILNMLRKTGNDHSAVQLENKIKSGIIGAYGRDNVEENTEKWKKKMNKNVFMAFFGFLFVGIVAILGGYPKEGKEIAIFSIAAFFIPLLSFYNLNSDAEDRSLQMQMEFPLFINKVVFLVNSSYITTKAWQTAVTSATDMENPLYQELRYTIAEIDSGKPEADALNDFAKTLRVRQISRAITLIILNLTKGGDEVVAELQTEASECLEMKKTAALALSEKAETKLTLASTIMIFAVLAVLGAPALISLMTSY